MSKALLALLFFIMSGIVLHAEEGMWTTDHFPSEKVAKSYGFNPDQQWIEHVRLSSVRLALGCSGGLVSTDGLVQTNHHCARECIDDLGDVDHDLGITGFYAPTLNDEKKCPSTEINQLIGIKDVSARVLAATKNLNGSAYTDALKSEKALISKDCTGGDEHLRCDVVELYHGGQFHLYSYRRYQDVRLVFVPEEAIAFFGGDPDNFEFPRYDLDVSFMRIYENNRPLDSRANYFPYSLHPVQLGDLVFTSGHPGATNRLNTAEELEFQRDVVLPQKLLYLSELRGLLTEFTSLGKEQSRIGSSMLFGVENSLKALKGKQVALTDSNIISTRRQSDNSLQRKISSSKSFPPAYDHAWKEIKLAIDNFRPKRNRYVFLEGGNGFRSQLFGQARALLRYAEEKKKPDTERLPEFTDANFPLLRQHILSAAPVYPELEKLTLTFSLTKLREALGPDDPFVHKLFGNQSPAQLANFVIDNSKLYNLNLRQSLLDGGEEAIKTSDDPMLLLAAKLDPDMRAIRTSFENDFDAVLKKNYGLIAKADFSLNGTSKYPDATFSLRLSWGSVKGYRDGDKNITPLTKMGGAFDRATGSEPFDLPQSWIDAKDRINHDIPFNIASTNDIIGGNSGSPLINRYGEAVGLIFDGNRYSLGGDFGYDITANRAVSVSTAAILEALEKVYHADRIVEELKRR